MTRWLALSFSVLAAGCALTAVLTPARSFPPTEGEVSAPGLTQPVRVLRDAWGVPHIRASTERDLWYSIGYVHAQDRLFQMDLVRHLGSGRMSEWVGEDAVAFDVFMQSLELDKRIAQRLPQTDPRLLAVGEAYAQGVNAGAAALPALPVEYRVLGVEFEPWQLTDALSSSIINSWTLSQNAPTELVSLLLKDRLDAAAVDALFRWDKGSPPVDPWWDELRKVQIGAPAAPFMGVIEYLWGVSVPSASNNWAVSGARSADGKPILANDPHLIQFVPSVWHVLEGKGGPFHIAGASLAGTPFMATGHNERVAWGVTNVMADYVDLAVVERKGELGYVLEGQERALRPVDVEVKVKGERQPRSGRVYYTDVGPVITELTGTHLVALRWHVLEVEDHTSDLFYAIQGARSVDEVLQATRWPSMIAQNLAIADVDGDIAWQAFGSTPQRRGYTGRVPYPAWRADMGWEGWVTPLPGEKNPERGYVHTANTRPDSPQADAISTAYLPPWRLDGIAWRLEATPLHTPESFHSIQNDGYDRHAREWVPRLLKGVDVGAHPCGQYLAEWDYDTGEGSRGMAVWAVFQEALIDEAAGEVLGEVGLKLYKAATISSITVIEAGLEHFTPDVPGAVARALDASCERLEGELGPDPATWRWGELHPLHIRHPFSLESAALSGWDMPRIPWRGSHSTINQSGYSWYHSSLEATWIASLRIITPLSDPGRAMFVYPGGQSGMPGHPHFADLFPLYQRSELAPLHFHDKDVEAGALQVLTLRP